MATPKGEAFIFAGARNAQPLSQMAMLMLLRRMERADLTAHGFRSTFRDWCAEATSYPHEMAELAPRTPWGIRSRPHICAGLMIERRRRMMDDWADHCASQAGDVVALAHPQRV